MGTFKNKGKHRQHDDKVKTSELRQATPDI